MKAPKQHSKTKISVWWNPTMDKLRILQPSGLVEFYAYDEVFLHSAYSELTANIALIDLKRTHKFLGYL